MTHYKFILLALIFFPVCTAFKNSNVPPARTYNLFYVDNSYSNRYENFGTGLSEIIDQKVDSIREDRVSPIGIFLADAEKTVFASNYTGAKNFVARLSEGNSSIPNSLYDRSFIIEKVLSTDLSNIKYINLNLFLTEAGLQNDYLTGGNAGMLINSLPREFQFLLELNEENIRVIIYYPENSKKIKLSMLQSFTNFAKTHSEFSSKIKFLFQPI